MHPTYKKMLKALQAKEPAPLGGVKEPDDWELYILKCRDGSFYTGVTKDIERRLKMHQEGNASKYTRTRRPVELLYHEYCGSRTQALVRECAVKELPRKKKEELVLGIKPKKKVTAAKKRKVRSPKPLGIS
jgi:predicted GIY-YIG superfamily endonuclease